MKVGERRGRTGKDGEGRGKTVSKGATLPELPESAGHLLLPEQAGDAAFMQQALALARQAADSDEVPIGALLVLQGDVVGTGFNQPRRRNDPTAHAEIEALRAASQQVANYRLPGTTLYVTVEPCTMCFGAIIHARVERLVFGAAEPRYGAVISGQQLLANGRYNHRLTVTGGVLAESCGALMKAFFRSRRSGPS